MTAYSMNRFFKSLASITFSPMEKMAVCGVGALTGAFGGVFGLIGGQEQGGQEMLDYVTSEGCSTILSDLLYACRQQCGELMCGRAEDIYENAEIRGLFIGATASATLAALIYTGGLYCYKMLNPPAGHTLSMENQPIIDSHVAGAPRSFTR